MTESSPEVTEYDIENFSNEDNFNLQIGQITKSIFS